MELPRVRDGDKETVSKQERHTHYLLTVLTVILGFFTLSIDVGWCACQKMSTLFSWGVLLGECILGSVRGNIHPESLEPIRGNTAGRTRGLWAVRVSGEGSLVKQSTEPLRAFLGNGEIAGGLGATLYHFLESRAGRSSRQRIILTVTPPRRETQGSYPEIVLRWGHLGQQRSGASRDSVPW